MAKQITVVLIQWAMGQPPGSILTVGTGVAKALIDRGAAEPMPEQGVKVSNKKYRPSKVKAGEAS